MPSVLLVDDHEAFLRAAASVVEANDEFVLAGTAVSGEDALALLAGGDVDLLILDLHLGGPGRLDGLATARRYCAEGGSARVILMSTTRRDDLPVGALDTVDAFIPKEEFSTAALDRLWRIDLR